MLPDGQRMGHALPNSPGLHPQATPAPKAVHVVGTQAPPGTPMWSRIEANVGFWAPIVFMALICIVLWRTMKLMPRTKPQQMKPEAKSSVSWDDVAGADEARAELHEVIEFLRDPPVFHALGAIVPKGILPHGPPGTGK